MLDLLNATQGATPFGLAPSASGGAPSGLSSAELSPVDASTLPSVTLPTADQPVLHTPPTNAADAANGVMTAAGAGGGEIGLSDVDAMLGLGSAPAAGAADPLASVRQSVANEWSALAGGSDAKLSAAQLTSLIQGYKAIAEPGAASVGATA